MNTLPTTNEMANAFDRRDASYDGLFFVGVRTTGIFCRPSCPARRPLPENITYFASVREAMLAGYRACLRCRPLDTAGAAPDWAQALVSEIDTAPEIRITDIDLRCRGIDPATARRFFLKQYGMTF